MFYQLLFSRLAQCLVCLLVNSLLALFLLQEEYEMLKKFFPILTRKLKIGGYFGATILLPASDFFDLLDYIKVSSRFQSFVGFIPSLWLLSFRRERVCLMLEYGTISSPSHSFSSCAAVASYQLLPPQSSLLLREGFPLSFSSVLFCSFSFLKVAILFMMRVASTVLTMSKIWQRWWLCWFQSSTSEIKDYFKCTSRKQELCEELVTLLHPAALSCRIWIYSQHH